LADFSPDLKVALSSANGTKLATGTLRLETTFTKSEVAQLTDAYQRTYSAYWEAIKALRLAKEELHVAKNISKPESLSEHELRIAKEFKDRGNKYSPESSKVIMSIQKWFNSAGTPKPLEEVIDRVLGVLRSTKSAMETKTLEIEDHPKQGNGFLEWSRTWGVMGANGPYWRGNKGNTAKDEQVSDMAHELLHAFGDNDGGNHITDYGYWRPDSNDYAKSRNGVWKVVKMTTAMLLDNADTYEYWMKDMGYLK
jgi:hypothetical protein